MKYEKAREIIQTGDVLLFRKSKSLFGKLIRWWTRSPFSHAGVALKIKVNGHFKLAVMEAMEPGGIRMYPLDLYLKKEKQAGSIIDLYQVVDPTVDRERIADFCLTKWGLRYASPWQFLWSFGHLSKKLRFRYQLPADVNPDRYFCSELVAAALEYAGYVPEAEFGDPATTSPGDVSLFPCLHRVGSLEV